MFLLQTLMIPMEVDCEAKHPLRILHGRRGRKHHSMTAAPKLPLAKSAVPGSMATWMGRRAEEISATQTTSANSTVIIPERILRLPAWVDLHRPVPTDPKSFHDLTLESEVQITEVTLSRGRIHLCKTMLGPVTISGGMDVTSSQDSFVVGLRGQS